MQIMTYSALNERSVPFYLYRFRQFKHRIRSFTRSIDDELMEQRPRHTSWTIAECLDHIAQTNFSYLSPLQRAIQEHATEYMLDEEEETGFHQRFWMRWFIWLMEPPFHLHFKAPSMFKPETDIHTKQALHELMEAEDEVIHLLEEHPKLNWGAVKHPHPVLPFFKLNASETLSLMEAHQRRHLHQAIEIHRQLLLMNASPG